MVRPFSQDPKLVGVKGAYKTRQKGLTARFVQLEYEDKYVYMQRYKYIDFIDTYAAAFLKEVFLGMDGYDTEFPVACAEDIELSYRLSQAGHKMSFNPKAIVYHTHPDSGLAYLKKKYKFAYWRMLALKKNPNKIAKDTHTPQIMKFQLLFPLPLLMLLVASCVFPGFLYVFGIVLLFFLLTTYPFIKNTLGKDSLTSLLSPVFLFERAAAQFLGVVNGCLYLIKQQLNFVR